MVEAVAARPRVYRLGLLSARASSLSWLALRRHEVDGHFGRHGDRTVERSMLLPYVDVVRGLLLVDAAEREVEVDVVEVRHAGLGANGLAGDGEGAERQPLLLGVQLNQRHAAGGNAGQERLAGGDGLVRAGGRVDYPVVGASMVQRPPGDVGALGPDGVAALDLAHPGTSALGASIDRHRLTTRARWLARIASARQTPFAPSSKLATQGGRSPPLTCS